MIWRLKNIKDGIDNERIKTHTVSPPQQFNTNHPKIAIIGGGPKGMYGFERLLAEINSSDDQEPLEIHIFNENEHFGSGNNYSIDQPEYLLINYSIGNINMWIDEEPISIAPHNLSLLDWINFYNKEDTLAEETHFASRALVGKYLQYGLSEIIKNIPSHVMVKLIIGHVTDIMELDQKYKLTLGDGLIANTYDRLLLATGHSNKYFSQNEINYKELADTNEGTIFIPKVYPVEPKLTELPKNLRIAIKGMGLTFVDAVLALTEGRGGSFSKNTDFLDYKKSGGEPNTIYAFSRGAIPMLPRGPLSKAARYRLKFFTAQFVKEIQLQYPHGTIDFEKVLLPIIKQEYRYAYYSTWMNNLSYDYGSHLDLFEEEIVKFREKYKQVPFFSMEKFLNPNQDLTFKSKEEYHSYIIEYLERAIAEAKIGELKSPLMAAVAVWREITPLINPLYEFGGFTAASQKVFEQQYYGKFSRVTFGPPIENMEKIVTLAKNSILQFVIGPSPKVTCNNESGKYRIESSNPPFTVETDCLIDARIAKPTLREGSSEIYLNLIQRNIATPFKNQNYSPGCINISTDGYILDPDGNKNLRIALTGTPTEGATLDNDTLSRTRNNFVSNWAKTVINSFNSSEAFTAK